ncbi:MAG: O-sialoglycoprotein endopeptidase [Eubacteriaceae bacterium]|nr:O-sialoglycoprotein endopeptidase [Eubacteriaceae bacterium]
MILGIDTSNYTTSVALADDGGLRLDRRRPVAVGEGQRGIRQSEAFWQHVNSLPELLDGIEFSSLDAVCVSDAPRRQEGSYMPCFMAGVRFAEAIASGAKIPLFRVSHQMGHIRAALEGTEGLDLTKPFLSVHLSGGTTEVLLTDLSGGDISCRIEGGTSDISAGQFIDRAGVALGISFPAGSAMDAMFDENAALKLPVSIRDGYVSFSGVETKVQRMIASGEYPPASIASGVFRCVALSVAAMINDAAERTGVGSVLLAGGVSSSANIRSMIGSALRAGTDLYCASDGMGSDNACGVALLGREYFSRTD